MNRPAPDFVIAGAPKCGTTSVYATLKQHRELFFPSIKEPHYFAFDHPWLREVETPSAYDRLFANAEEGQLRGDASAHYLVSEHAIPAILERRPDVKFIVLLRNPVDMFISYHNELIKTLVEDEPSLSEAWHLQGERAMGKSLPPRCQNPTMLQYKKICSLGYQIKRLFELAEPSQRLVLFHEDLVKDPRSIYVAITQFLNVGDEGTKTFLQENNFARYDSVLVAKIMESQLTNKHVKWLKATTKGFLNDHGIRPLFWLSRRHLKPVEKPVLDQEFTQELVGEFSSDIALLEELVQRDLSHWYRKSEEKDCREDEPSSSASLV